MLPQSRKKSRKKTDGTELEAPGLGRPRNLDTRPDGPAPIRFRPLVPAAPPTDPAPDGPQDLGAGPQFPRLPQPPPLPPLPPGPGTAVVPLSIGRSRLVRENVPRLPTATVTPVTPPTADAALRPRLARSPVIRDGVPQIPMPTPEDLGAEQERRARELLEQELLEGELRERRALHFAATATTLAAIYAFYYENGVRKTFYDKGGPQEKNPFKTVYDRFTASSSPYTATPIGHATFEAFKQAAEKAGGEVESQIALNTERVLAEWRIRNDDYDRAIAIIEEKKFLGQPLSPEDLAYLKSDPPPKPDRPVRTIEDALPLGDYFRVSNKRYTLGYTMPIGTMRRIIVNMVSQQAALEVAGTLNALYEHSGISPWISEYKIFLATAVLAEDIKFDKIVVYYVPQAAESGEDFVGGLLVSAIVQAIPPGTAVDEFGPFYSRVAPGIAWAEDPSTVPGLQELSFSQSRISAVAAVIRSHRRVPTPEEFTALVTAEMRTMQIHPSLPHRHLGGPPDRSPRPSRS